MNEPIDRGALLRALNQNIPSVTGGNRLLTLPSVAAMEEADPANAAAFARRREALFENYRDLANRISHLNDAAQYCRYYILKKLFARGSCTVDECWQGVYAIRGAEVRGARDVFVYG